MRDILQSRYLRRRVAHKQLARTSLNISDCSSQLAHLVEMIISMDWFTCHSQGTKSSEIPEVSMGERGGDVEAPKFRFDRHIAIG